MDIKTLESFKLSDAITFHDELNPKLWAGTNLRPEVKRQLKLIADDFMDELGISGVDVIDVTVSGSNAAYSYTPHSDLDLHILVDMSEMPNDEVYKELFNAKKDIYNDSHNITIHGVPVEVYVQDANQPVISLGEYSIKNNDWIKLPTKRRANFDQTAVKSKYNKLLDLINLALKSNKLHTVSKVLKKIRQYRQAGLDKGGEFGPENLAYKALRSKGYLTKLYALRDKLHSEVLTIENMYQNPTAIQEEKNKLPHKIYHVTPASNLDSIMKAGLRPQVGARSNKITGEQSAIYCFPDKHSVENAMMNWLGDEFDEDEELALLEIDTRNLTGEYTPNAEFEIAITSLIPPNRIKVLSSLEEDYDPNGKPPGPEFKPTMPAGTVKVDVSDVYDWYKLGQHISNLKGLGKHDFGSGPPSTIMAFGSEPEEHKYIKDLEKTGLTTTDIDPVDPNQPKGMKRQKVDPTYNVNEAKVPSIRQQIIDDVKNNGGNIDEYFVRFTDTDKLGFSAKQGFGQTLDVDNPKFDVDYIGQSEGRRALWFYPLSYYLKEKNNIYASESPYVWLVKLKPNAWMQTVKRGDDKLQPAPKGLERVGMLRMSNPPAAIFFTHGFDVVGKYYDYAEQHQRHGEVKGRPTPSFFDKVRGLDEDETLQYASEKTPTVNPYAGVKDRQFRGDIAEASGYIPSEKEKNDPRFKTALTVDVKPDSIKKNAKAFYWKTSRAGIPPIANPSGKF